MAVTMIRTLKQESPRFWRGLMLVGCLRYKVAPLRCLGILSSGKVKKKLCNLKNYEIEKYVADSTLTQFLYLRTYIVLILCRGM